MEYKITTNSEEDTIVLAQNIESEKFENMVICLIGELGSGKTIFTKGLADALGIEENITSPTYNMVSCLTGDLGSRKTLFTKGFAKAMEIDDEVTSPTFNIIKEYLSGDMPLYHMDVYRLDGDVTELGLEDYFNRNGIVVIEWANMIKEYLPEERLEIKFSVQGEEKRVLTIKPYGEKYEALCEDAL